MSDPKLFLLRDGERHPISLPFHGADHADMVDGSPCPKCGATSERFGIQGSSMRPSDDDRAWEADGRATCCGAHVGTIRAETDTLFGVREDQAVLQGRCRVY